MVFEAIYINAGKDSYRVKRFDAEDLKSALQAAAFDRHEGERLYLDSEEAETAVFIDEYANPIIVCGCAFNWLEDLAADVRLDGWEGC